MLTEVILCLQAQKYIQSLPSMPPQDLEKIFRGANPLGGWCLCPSLDKHGGISVSVGCHLLPCLRQPSTSSSVCWFWTVMGGSLPARPWPTPTSHSTTIQTTSPKPPLTIKAWRAKTELWRSGKARWPTVFSYFCHEFSKPNLALNNQDDK